MDDYITSRVVALLADALWRAEKMIRAAMRWTNDRPRRKAWCTCTPNQARRHVTKFSMCIIDSMGTSTCERHWSPFYHDTEVR